MAIPVWLSLTMMGFAGGSFVYAAWSLQKNPGAAPWRDVDDDTSTALLLGTIENWPSKDNLISLLEAAGLETKAGEHAVRLSDSSSFVFRNFDQEVSPSLSADHASVDRLCEITEKVSVALARNNITHRFEVYDGDGKLAAKFHHQ